MRYVSLFSGIEAASVAWGPLGWEPVAFAEIEPFCCAVLAERFPNVPNLGDVAMDVILKFLLIVLLLVILWPVLLALAGAVITGFLALLYAPLYLLGGMA